MAAKNRRAAAPLVVALMIAGCGGQKPLAGSVRLDVAAPADGQTVRSDHAVISGTVAPAKARVLVDGRPATRNGERFEASVPLPEGTIVVDVLAEADRYRPAMTALRVRRPFTVQVPDLKGRPVTAAKRSLSALGLAVKVDRSGGLFDDLLPGELRVCGSDPEAGSTVELPATVTLNVAHLC